MIVSIETPVFKGKWLTRCINSVLTQSSKNWRLSLLWDGGDEQSREILEELEKQNHPNVTVYFKENRGIANARRYLSKHSEGDYIMPLDDDDVLAADAVEKMLAFVEAKPWSGIVRGKRKFIDEEGRVVDEEQWFPFEPRHYQHGMVTDVFNHSQPYLINRIFYNQTSGWEGFEDFKFAGEDCDIILKLEERASIELLDKVLYYYRLNPNRASNELEVEGAHEMWRRLADISIARMGLPVKRQNDVPPYTYERLPQPHPTIDMIDFVIPIIGEAKDSKHANRHQEALEKFGVTEDAVHFVSLPDGGINASYNRGFHQTTRPLICFLDEGAHLDEPKVFDTLLATMHQQLADIISPRILSDNGVVCSADPYFNEDQLPISRGSGERDENQFSYISDAEWLPVQFLLVRREVINAVGGFDEGFVCSQIQSADFCLKARIRDFKCVYDGTVAVVCNIDSKMEKSSVSVKRYHEKWSSHAHFFLGH
jgi:glycosyltransferase involved in cell wall biosynthesis